MQQVTARFAAVSIMVLLMSAAVGCGGQDSPVPRDTTDAQGPDNALPDTETGDADTSVEPFEDIASADDGGTVQDFLPDQPGDEDVGSDEGDSMVTVCTELTVDVDCASACAQAGPCQVCRCDTTVPGGACELVTAEQGHSCEDGEPCTRDDYCENGTCLPGRVACECLEDGDCAAGEDGNKCNGTLFCNRDVFPYSCDVDPLTVVKCSTSGDTECSKNTCAPETGDCLMTAIREGQECTSLSTCILEATCQEGQCSALVSRDCNDNNPCTDDSCEELLGCVRLNNTSPCNDGSVCTLDDTCFEGACGHTSELKCDNGVFCDGAESCDPVSGCQNGTKPTCDDGNACTLDRCLTFYDRCFNDWIPTAGEGPRGSTTCTDGVDNDCDGSSDIADPECLLGVDSVNPDNGVLSGGDLVILTGNSLDVVEKVTFAGVEGEILSATALEIEVVAPPGTAAGAVDVAVSSPHVTFTVPDGYTYTLPVAAPDFSCILETPTESIVRDVGASIVDMTGLSLIPQTVPGNMVVFSFGYGPRGSDPTSSPGWMWTEASPVGATVVGANYRTSWAALPVAERGGYFDVAARVSIDGGIHWLACDLDGSANGFSSSSAPDLTVYGAAEKGDVVINELMWMGTAADSNDEWVELRNMTDAPIKLDGWKLTAAGYPAGQDFLFQTAGRVVNNTTIPGRGYFILAQFNSATSARNVEADILAQDPSSGSRTMRLYNTGPRTYNLIDNRGIIIDSAYFSGSKGEVGSVAANRPYKSMERRAVPGPGISDADWISASLADGWDGDPFQSAILGTPGAANSDVALCTADTGCLNFHTEISTTRCQARVCHQPEGRCAIVDIPDAGSCDDGLFCTTGETCQSGICGGGSARDCSDTGSIAYCTIDSCDEDADTCVHVFDTTVSEGPRDSSKCRDWIDNDCDGFTDSLDMQCKLDVESVTPGAVPVDASLDGWTATITGTGFVNTGFAVTGVAFSGPGGVVPAGSFIVSDQNTIAVELPSVSEPGYYDVQVTDGTVTAVLAGGILFFGTASDMLGRISYPTDPMIVNAGQPTPYIKGRVKGSAIGTGAGMVSPSLIKAEAGYGPDGTDPSTSAGWTWLTAAYDSTCSDCVDEHQFRRTVTISSAGTWALAYRFSIDGGVTWAWGSLGPYSTDPWDVDGALTVTVMGQN